MKVYISGDIEGITGLTAWSQCGRPNSDHYDFRWARERYTGDLNAAIRGCREAGAERIVVKDSHGNSKNLLVDMLEPGVELITGHGAGIDGMMQGIDGSFDAAMLIGYHAMAGTQAGVMEHTISGRVHRMWINGMPAGEIALSTAVAGKYGVPMVAISSDEAGCAEAAALVSGIQTAAVKKGLGRYMTHTLQPEVSAPLIQAAAAEGLRVRASVRPWTPDAPTTIRLEFNRSEEADMAAKVPTAVRVDAFTVEATGAWDDAHRACWTMIAMADIGFRAND